MNHASLRNIMHASLLELPISFIQIQFKAKKKNILSFLFLLSLSEVHFVTLLKINILLKNYEDFVIKVHCN